MRIIFILVVLFLVPKLFAAQVRVRILANENSVHVSADRFKLIADIHQCADKAVKIKAKHSDFTLTYLANSNWQITNLDDQSVCELRSQKLRMSGEKILINGRVTPSLLSIDPALKNFDVIAYLDIEKYLAGVLAKEMPAGFPLEAFKAQAIASRSYALKKLKSTAQRSYDLENNVSDQVFEYSSGNEKIRSAISETKNLILEDKGGNIFPVYYHADCGGQTEEASDVWGAGEKLGTTVDDACLLETRSNWSFAISKLELSMRLRVVLQLADAQIAAIEEFETTSSGRKKSLKLVLDDHSTRIISGQQLRNILGFDKLKSTLFALNDSGARFVFEGRGHGHGVGMCQWGARHLALAGETYNKILKHYYPRARLASLSDLRFE